MRQKKRLTKTQFIEMLSEKTGAPKSRVEKHLNLSLDIIETTLERGGSVQLSGFGTFYVRQRAARTGVNPATLRKMKIRAMKVPAFKPGEKLKKAIE